jgi:hypothetical protein
MIYQSLIAAFIIVGLVSGSIGNSPIAASGAFVAAGLFAIADAMKSKQ